MNRHTPRAVKTKIREWAYSQAYDTSEQRKKELSYWLHHQNWHRRHAGIKRKLPISSSS
jgi:hypothetical protein